MSAEMAGAARRNGFTLTAVLPWLAILASWLLLMDYQGLDHDALLYTFQALARLHPELYAGDVYLSHGSQDDFSAFSFLYSGLVEWLGAERAAAWTTFLAIMALLCTSWMLARRVAPASLALLGLAFLVVMPTGYGPSHTFRVLELYLTPRMPAEALAIGAMLAMLAGRRVLAALLLAGSLSLHPLMAAPAVWIVLFLAMPQERRWLLPVLSVIGLMLIAAGGSLSWLDPYRVDPQWREFFDSYAAYLFAGNWSVPDWMIMCPAYLTLVMGARLLEEPQARQLCVAALLVGLLGLAVMAVGADWLRIALVVQGQAYRWSWPAMLVAVLLLPHVALRLWRVGTLGRAAALALAALWLSSAQSFGPVVALVAGFVCLLALGDRVAQAYRRWALIGAGLMLAVATCFSVAERMMIVTNPYSETYASGLAQGLRLLFAAGPLAVVALIGVFALARAQDWLVTRGTVTLALCLACMVLLPMNYLAWSRRDFPSQLHSAFAPWRKQIPPGSEVVWIEKPDYAWLLLERPSYYSVHQSLSGIFSRTVALDMMDRASRLVPLMKRDDVKGTLGFVPPDRGAARAAARTLHEVCDAIDARYVVARSNFGEDPLAESPSGVPASYRAMKLYRCNPTST